MRSWAFKDAGPIFWCTLGSFLAWSFHRLSEYYSDIGEFEGTVVNDCKAVDLQRNCAPELENPDTFDPVLADYPHKIAWNLQPWEIQGCS